MEIDKLENPFIKVTWEDIPENFTQEKIKRVRTYFKNKYNSKNITVLTRSIDRKTGDNLDIDLEQNVMDPLYQRTLMSQFIMSNGMDVDIELLKRLDDKVNAKISDEAGTDTKYKRVYIKKIKFSNFLSFGDNNTIDFNKLGGITVVDSNPPNFGGKSVLAVDLILFLFFNSTKASEIFNRFRKSNEVFVQGEVEIDGNDYIILRKVKRKKTKKGDWSVSTSLEFLERKKDGTLQNFTGEQRRETEKFIKESIGTMEDFLLTVLSTAGNLESLIESKPTERGTILSRFIGLESLKDKEDVCKKMYSEWSKKLISNVYDVEELKEEIKTVNTEKDNLVLLNTGSKTELTNLTNKIADKNISRDELVSQKNTTIDVEIQKVNPRLLEENINEDVIQLEILHKKLSIYGSSKKLENVDLEVLKDKKIEVNKLILEKTTDNANFRNLNKIIKELEESENCPLCKRMLDDVDHSKEIKKLKKESQELNNGITTTTKIIQILETTIDSLESQKLVFDEYEKNMLREERLRLEIGQKELKINKLKDNLVKYNENKGRLNKNAELDKEILTINSQLDILDANKEKLFRELEINNNRVINIDDLIYNHNIKIDKIKKENDLNKIFRAYLTAFGKNGIIKTIVKSVVPKLNNELMRLLLDVTNFMVEIRVNDKNEVEFWMVDNNTSVERPLSSGSGFEKTLACLAIRTVLTKVSCLPRPNVTVFDEVLGKVSNENLDQVGLFFSRVKDYFENVFLITHNPLVREWADNVVTINKEKNISSLL